MGEPAMRQFFHAFLEKFVAEEMNKWILYPKNVEEAAPIEAVFTTLGFPGCVGSTDCTHVAWEKCPASLQSACSGKVGYPTIGYEVTVDNHRRVLFCSQGHPGARNDKKIVLYDEYVMGLKDKTNLADFKFELRTRDGGTVQREGAWLIVDGGYHLWRCLQPPIKCAWREEEIFYSCRLESVRKNVECFFGVLKQRFSIVKYPFRYHDKQKCDNVFFVCCILHNMLLEHDGRDKDLLQVENWVGMDEDDIDIHYAQQILRARSTGFVRHASLIFPCHQQPVTHLWDKLEGEKMKKRKLMLLAFSCKLNLFNTWRLSERKKICRGLGVDKLLLQLLGLIQR
jgi:hypothetical protein